jgi:hypothetical protein
MLLRFRTVTLGTVRHCKMSTYPIEGSEDIMRPKAHGSTEKPVMDGLRWNCSREKADNICCFNRHYAEHSGYWLKTNFLKELNKEGGPITFYDSVTGKPLFVAPKGRTWDEFIEESSSHGWPSFRDEEVSRSVLYAWVVCFGPASTF